MAVFNNVLAGSSGQTVGGGAYEIERSLRFNSVDTPNLSKIFASSGNRRAWTWAGWVKQCKPGQRSALFGVYTDANNFGLLEFFSDKLRYTEYQAGLQTANLNPNNLFRDYSAWQHVVAVYDSDNATSTDRIRLYTNGLRITGGIGPVYPSGDSYLNQSAITHRIGTVTAAAANTLDGYLADIHFIDGQALDPTSFGEFDTNGVWQPKAYSGTYGTNGFHLPFSDNSTAAALGTDSSGNGNDWTVNNISVGTTSTAQPRWYSSPTLYYTKADVVANATDRGTGSFTTDAGGEYVYVVINNGGTPGTDNVFSSNFPQLTNIFANIGGTYDRQGSYGTGEGTNFDWTDAAPTFTVLSNTADFYAFSTSSTGAGDDTPSGTYASKTFSALITSSFRTAAQINVNNDSLVDVPTNGTEEDTGVGGEVRGNYCTWNPLGAGAGVTLSNGNLSATTSDGSGVAATIGVSSGKWYYELTAGNTFDCIGIYLVNTSNAAYPGSTATSYGYYASNGWKYYNSGGEMYGAQYVGGDVIGVALDLDAGTISFYKNGVSQGIAFTGLSGTYTPGLRPGNNSAVSHLNFGQRPFDYTVPSGFKALCTTNLPEPDPNITPPSKVMDVVTYTGTGGARSISGLGFSPDFVWIKNRNVARSHRLFDAVRGATIRLYSDTTGAEGTDATSLTQFNADGFNLEGNAGVNNLNDTYVAWTWDAGSSTVTNTDGSITSQVRANPSAGFSVVSFSSSSTGGTVGHGLNMAPSLIICKNRDATSNWPIYHTSLGTSGNNTLILDGTLAAYNSNYLTAAAPTSSVFSHRGFGASSTANYIAYCFAPVDGYSSFGSYTGNGSADGPFVFTGFRPRWILVKCSAGVANVSWNLHDTERSPENSSDRILLPNDAGAEQLPSTVFDVDILSNGFKMRASHDSHNQSGATYIYAAFAESPFQYARAR